MRPLILLIEDNEQNRYLATFLLERAGYVVVHAPDGPRALKMVQTMVPDLILLDIQLPVMDGYSVARKLREIERLRLTPVIAVTSHAMVGDREKALAAGFTGYIEKPIDPDTFIAELAGYRAIPA